MGITLDNAIIDFNTINNIVNTLQTHEDLFTQFNNQALVTASNINTGGVITSNSLNVGSVTFAAIRAKVSPGTPLPITYGPVFVAQPTIVATVEGTSATTYVAQIESTAPVSGSTTYSQAVLHVYDVLKTGQTTPVTVNIIAIGQV
jgi:hypothetical protein